jgi:hypothetical protein
MSNNKQSSVDYLIEQLLPKALSAEQFYHIQQAKAMHKEEIIDAHERGQSDEKDYWNIGDKVGVRFMVKSNEYYKEKFNK